MSATESLARRLAAAAGGVIQAAQTNWYFVGGDLAAAISERLDVLERGIGTDPSTWSPVAADRHVALARPAAT